MGSNGLSDWIINPPATHDDDGVDNDDDEVDDGDEVDDDGGERISLPRLMGSNGLSDWIINPPATLRNPLNTTNKSNSKNDLRRTNR